VKKFIVALFLGAFLATSLTATIGCTEEKKTTEKKTETEKKDK